MANPPALMTLISSNEMNKMLYPAFSHLTDYLKIPTLTSDSLYLNITTLIESYYLHFHDSSLSENYWGVKRITSLTEQKLSNYTKIISYVEIVLIPFLNNKLAQLHTDQHHESGKSKVLRWLIKYYPYINILISAINTMMKVSYFLGYTNKTSIIGTMFGISFASKTINPVMGITRRGLDLLFPLAMFYVNFLKQWNSRAVLPYEVKVKPPPPSLVSPKKCGVCPICNEQFKIPAAVPTTGVVYCYVCIFEHIRKSGCCPLSKMQLSADSLVILNGL